ncbi:uncharacterized protein VTP21DRAFT_2784 [Calcarisporiella thermophila]|uniref:uncharacterized protein n=1 Tax=Calcarisporiella thermophila TaxID=911321 RepID=UPI0037421CB5
MSCQVQVCGQLGGFCGNKKPAALHIPPARPPYPRASLAPSGHLTQEWERAGNPPPPNLLVSILFVLCAGIAPKGLIDAALVAQWCSAARGNTPKEKTAEPGLCPISRRHWHATAVPPLAGVQILLPKRGGGIGPEIGAMQKRWTAVPEEYDGKAKMDKWLKIKVLGDFRVQLHTLTQEAMRSWPKPLTSSRRGCKVVVEQILVPSANSVATAPLLPPDATIRVVAAAFQRKA